ncbi:hypothetical protein LHP98_03265 [Rhodobacter sp. Har01]|uniref:hypothetical protein n=1 Tax=Rhodobacter sp. Har01 TaxID=2883999 RepID=UPI001D07A35A|nr:hypothetical protein [Rhodobacter sp. Har01]MCB6177148.1 hypothetical protein [Rhodobacter sp. Har01]
MMAGQNASFEARIARIRAGQASGKATVFVGQDLTFSYRPKSRQRRGGLGDVLRNAGFVLVFPLCLGLGFLSHALGRYADWVLNGVPQTPENVDFEMAMVALIGACIAVVLAHLAGLREKALRVPLLMGVVVGMLSFHNLVHLYPDTFETLFSPIWVARITSITEPHSLLFRGISFPF